MPVLRKDKLVTTATLTLEKEGVLTLWTRPFSMRGLQPGQEKVHRFKSQSGQVVLEYILLLMISVGAATYMTKRLVGRSADDPGVITSAWSQINEAIASDIID